MEDLTFSNIFTSITTKDKPAAIAWLYGNDSHPDLCGKIHIHATPFSGVIITAEIYGLPNQSQFFAMHIHENGDCTPPFTNTGMHYNPDNEPHPNHAGDLPPLLGNNGFAFSSFFDTRFTLDEIIGKSVIIHSNRDDFTSQPAGDSGVKIGCGTIKWL